MFRLRAFTSLTYVISNLLIILLILSCSNKPGEKTENIIASRNYLEIFYERNRDKPEMVCPIDYYKGKIMENQKILSEPRRINTIEKIDDIIPGILCFLVGYDDLNVGRGEGFDIIG